jgi:hypothetical protein
MMHIRTHIWLTTRQMCHHQNRLTTAVLKKTQLNQMPQKNQHQMIGAKTQLHQLRQSSSKLANVRKGKAFCKHHKQFALLL